MIKRIVGWFILIPLCAVLIVFALANRHTVSVHFDPISTDNPLVSPADVPLFAVIYAMLILGVLFGGIAVWFTQGKNRREKRNLKRETGKLSRELEKVRKASRPNAGEDALLIPTDLLEDEGEFQPKTP